MQTTELQTKLENQKGFTLVEIAIVLVIIGLLLGGVLKGQELVENAKIKSVGKDFENMAAAYYAYKDRTGQYPTATTTAAGDDAFWFDLKNEGFIAGELGTSTASDGPTHAYDGEYVAVLGNAGSNLKAGKTYICAEGIEGSVAQSLDTVNDDGVHTSGSFRGAGTTADGLIAAAADQAANDYTDDTSLALCREL